MFEVSSYLTSAASAWPLLPALFENDRCVATFAELDRRVNELARYFGADLGLRAGDRVVLFSDNSARYVELMLASWRTRLTVTPVNARLHPAELAYIAGDSGARLCLTTSRQLDAVSEALAAAGMSPDCTAVGDIDADPEGWPAPGTGKPCADADASIAWLFYTSGTTGKPKGVMITHENLRQMVLNYLADIESIRPGDCIVHFGPLSHGSGLYLLPHLARGASSVVARGIEPSLRSIQDLSRGTGNAALFMAPTMIRRLIEDRSTRPDAIRTLVFGGGPMHLSLLKDAHSAFGTALVQIYGQGESPMTITCMRRLELAAAIESNDRARMTSVGRAFTGVELRIHDNRGAPLPVGQAGEIVVRGPTVMRGYWNRPDATADTIRNGWLRTGDIGALDAEGFLTLLDRSKDMVVSGGMNIYSREVEEALLTHPDVAEAAVIGEFDAEWGEAVVACVVAKGGADLLPEQLDRHCLERLARFKRPKRYRFLDELPKNNYGKILKRELKQRFHPVQ